MSIIRPFAAIRYATPEPGTDVSTRLAPPYDILDQQDKAALLAADPRNFVKVDLPHTPPKSAGPPEVYAAAARTLRDWLADGTMQRDPQPALYLYYQTFTFEGRTHTRKTFFARLRLEPFGEGGVFPHERTFGGPKEDRLSLTQATAANLSPIFGLYEDAAGAVIGALAAARPGRPAARGKLEVVENELWAVTAPKAIAAAAELMRSRPIYIADGHHRYGTGLLYRDWLTQREGQLPAEHPANYVLCALCAMEDPGLLILPTHRVLPGLKVTAELLGADERLTVTPLRAGEPEEAVRALAALGPQAVAGWSAAAREYFAVQPRRADILDALEPDHSPAWRRLGLAFLHEYLLRRVVAPRLAGGTEPAIRYVKAADEAVSAAEESGGTAFLMQATTMAELRGVCGAGDLMPQKSTYFYPKLASGLVVNPLTG